jgi:Flp pilus assembly pilin Flp
MLNNLYLRAAAMIASATSASVRDDGQALVEYALILSSVALAMAVAMKATGTNISSMLVKVAGEV